MPTAPKRPVATLEEALARPESERIELIRGTLVPKAAVSGEHSEAQAHTVAGLVTRFDRRPGGRWPGGWWIRTEIDIQLGDELFRPDLAGWRRENLPERPRGRPITVRPDWICEILSPSNEDTDRVDKLQSYFQAGVPHYWLANPIEKVLEVYRRTDVAYALVLTAKSGQTVRAEPFDAVELRVDELFGADPEDD
ncbi:MAG: Uma2 family endonuclease [Deltaproteobacteria bacterium]|nr:Uma2 family endonuclease [Deltaproteobacteria bacterium]